MNDERWREVFGAVKNAEMANGFCAAAKAPKCY